MSYFISRIPRSSAVLSPVNYALHVIADSSYSHPSQTLEQAVARAIQGGATMIQLREKPPVTTKQFVELARRIQKVTRAYQIPFIVNDRIDVALAVDADGIHIGQDDMPCELARSLIGPDRLFGVTISTPEQLDLAVMSGADYVGTDPIFPTALKPDKEPLGLKRFQQLCERSCIPVLGIGGVTASNARDVIKAGASGVAVISAVMNAPDVLSASQALRAVVSEALPVYDVTLAARAAQLLQKIRSSRPLIQHLTNFVVINDSANVTLQVGASPVMSVERELTNLAKAMVINIGTLDYHTGQDMSSASATSLSKFYEAAGNANAANVPIVLDPVAAGATKLRTELALNLLKKFKIAALRGNPGEIGTLAGVEAQVRGVECVSGPSDRIGVARKLALEFHTTVVMTGKWDLITDGTQTFEVHNNHAMLSTLTGMGCNCTAVVAVFLAVAENPSEYALAASCAVAYYTAAAERAARQVILERKGPGTFRARFWDELFSITPEQLIQSAKIVRLS